MVLISTASRDSATSVDALSQFDDTEPVQGLTPERITAQLRRIPGGAIALGNTHEKLTQPTASPSEGSTVRNTFSALLSGLWYCVFITMAIVSIPAIPGLHQPQPAVENIYPPTIASTKAAVEFLDAPEAQEALTVIRTYYGKQSQFFSKNHRLDGLIETQTVKEPPETSNYRYQVMRFQSLNGRPAHILLNALPKTIGLYSITGIVFVKTSSSGTISKDSVNWHICISEDVDFPAIQSNALDWMCRSSL
ncbi:MAG: hypothetical protein LH647_10195 [Leptolyngbyaceae cyanobacterium CAN_BIN12]|nr:hypothetical protein [Leptolyngbyaceae cyanobacterium CAN_BIN12]